MNGLTEQDRELLNIAVDFALDIYDEGKGWDDRTLDAAVEQIATRHVEAFRASLVTTIEAAIDAYVTTAGLPTFIATNTADAERTGRLVGLSAAARIVADHDSSAGHAASARPAEG